MSNEKHEFIERVAQGNPVDLDKVLAVQKLLSELERAGVLRRSVYSVAPPLGRLSELRRPSTLANAKLAPEAPAD